ncbi:uncharacterized protein LOC121308521 [Polyodon spathula]|uniref:uncharacterized protein LOC121308521 n=1 Tax=Polyodon spathula TaxID=7913 RepID=UPI001B7F1B46|nr:uncharacterized protein LOC121308521 [Polyodon spathula]
MASEDQTEHLLHRYSDKPDPSDSGDSAVADLVNPCLKEGEIYHVFISYSSADCGWAHGFIDRLEAARPGLLTCYHERDFIPGRTVLDNMADCIQGSQKVLLVLSKDFLQSRWCLLEANLSLFRDCIECKPVLPVLLEPCAVPLHLSHLTYLEAGDPNFFSKVLKVLCTPNHLLRSSNVVLFQPPCVYNGKVLLTQQAVEGEDIPNWKAGMFSTTMIPDQLRLVLEKPEAYRKAMSVINSVPTSRFCFRYLWVRVVLCIVLALLLSFLILLGVLISVGFPTQSNPSANSLLARLPVGLGLMVVGLVLIPSLIQITACWAKSKGKEMLREMRLRAGQANMILTQEKLLVGCESRTKLHFIYLSLEGCRETFRKTFQRTGSPAGGWEEQFHTALLYFSSGYACCVTKRHFPFPQPPDMGPGHQESGILCFCQYVSLQLRRGVWA